MWVVEVLLVRNKTGISFSAGDRNDPIHAVVVFPAGLKEDVLQLWSSLNECFEKVFKDSLVGCCELAEFAFVDIRGEKSVCDGSTNFV